MTSESTYEQRKKISFSELQLWETCQHRWSLDILAGKRSENFGVGMGFGTAIHSSMELMFPKVGERMSSDDTKRAFDSLLEAELWPIRDKVKDPEKVDILELFAAGHNIIDNVASCKELVSATVIMNEHKLEEPIARTDEGDILFKGYIDIVLKLTGKRGKTELWICDFKTCSWGWGRDKKEDPALHRQLLLYKHFLCKKFSLDPTNVRCAFILLKKKPQDPKAPAEWFPVSAGPKSVERAVNVLQTAVTQMRSGQYTKNRNECKNKWGDTCPYFGTPDCLDD